MSEAKYSLAGKVAIVTGGGTGIGKSIALEFARAGADVVVGSRRLNLLEETAEEVRTLGRRALAVQVDISRKADVDNMLAKAIGAFEHIDILVNNAAIAFWRPMLEVTEEEWDNVVDIDLKGYFLCSQAVAKTMVERGKGGDIINVASVAGVRLGEYMRKVETHLGVYAVAKAGVLMLNKALAQEWAPYDIRVNAISPTRVLTPMSLAWDNPEEAKRSSVYIPLGRIAQPDDVAGAALFLASDASNYVTGDNIMVDGGQTV
ncbi:SDR family NAD(P)-dependent oxidoreductase [Chloroflexota bacterium]